MATFPWSLFTLCLTLGTSSALVQGDFSGRSRMCGEPPRLKHGSWSLVGDGDFVSYQCHSGYARYGEETLRCQRDRRWSGQAPICVAPGCSPLPKFATGRAFVRMEGAVVVYKCPRLSWIQGSKTIFCDGTRWNDTVPTCRQQSFPRLDFLPISNCPPPPKVPGAVVVKSFESVAYTCVNRTFPTVGSEILRCLPSGQWDRTPIICAKTGCERLTEPENGLLIEMHRLSVVEFRCFLNYHLIGSRVLFCDGRRWNGTVPTCVQDIPVAPAPTEPATRDHSVLFRVREGTSCGQAPVVRHGTPRYTTELDEQGTTYWAVTYLCNPGFRLLRQGRLFCSRGAWIGESIQCVAHCGLRNGRCAHNCLDINGRATCTCRPGYRLHINGRSCDDINECAPNSGRGPCSERCHNYGGSYSCSCQRGYELNADGHSCAYQIVDPCSRMRCAYGSCVTVNGTASCQCRRGLSLSRDRRTCEDINECSRPSSPCEYRCRNTFGGYQCLCPSGSALVGGRRCRECPANTYLSSNGRRCKSCPENSITSDPGRPSIEDCRCRNGFHGVPGSSGRCEDVNECAIRNGGCQHSCINTEGSYFCTCNTGYTLDPQDQSLCIEIDECLLNNGGCAHQCRNSPGSFSCTCPEGFAVDPHDRFSCIDVNECAFDSSRCEHVCVNNVGSYFCTCPQGYRLNEDGSTCTAETCSPLPDPRNGRVSRSCGRDQGDTGLPVQTTCTYNCNRGYHLDGDEQLVCTAHGQWSGEVPRCVRTDCASFEPLEFGQILPESCRLGPSEPQSACTFSCQSGYHLLGASVVTCSRRGEWSRRAPICSKDSRIRCPENITAILPQGSSQMVVALPEADHVLDFVNASHLLSGHSFGIGETLVTYTAYTIDSRTAESCRMAVNVVDSESPQSLQCPQQVTLKVQERYPTSINLTQPTFTDNVAIVSVTREIFPDGVITWGEYTARYVATDTSGNTATCTFGITIQPLAMDCGVLDGPLNGHHFCTAWREGQMCQPACLPGFYFFDGPLPRATYTCDSNAQWSPSKQVPDCTAVELVRRNASVPCAAGKQLKTFPALSGPACMDCPRGMYSVDLGPATQPVCKLCPRGLYQDSTGRTSCLMCPDGTTTTMRGATSARQCEVTVESTRRPAQ
ncbi:uncharacterized protein [Diadema setosum]|uniref:uncharacterized protein n=1 Tax=Diadema setosum TaxID=31175 RepID=UPI003B3B22C2